MSGVRRLEHVELRVADLANAVSFYTDVLGFSQVSEGGDVVYLGCGLDDNFDLAVSEGGTGVEHFAVRAEEESIERYEERLTEHGVSTERTDGEEPGQEQGLRFNLPSGRLTMEIVTVSDSKYFNTADVKELPTTADVNPDRSPIAPVDLSHITAMSPNIEADVEFLRDVVGFSISDIGTSPVGGWIMAFTRFGDYHHDVAIFGDPENSLHHVAWEVVDVSHMIRLIDYITANGYEIETTPVRHGAGSNIAVYFQEPGGNRFELTTEVATVDRSAELEFHEVEEVPFSVWGGLVPPESFREGS